MKSHQACIQQPDDTKHLSCKYHTCIFCQYSDINHSFPKPVPSSCCSMNPLISNSKVLCLSMSHYTLPPVSTVKDAYALTSEYPVAVASKTPFSSLCPSANLHLSEHSQAHLPFPINWNFLNCARYHLSLLSQWPVTVWHLVGPEQMFAE